VIFLDEPTTGLDPRSRRNVWEIVGNVAAEGVTVLLTTQYLDEADFLADGIALIDGGRVVADGTPAELKRRVGGQRLDMHAHDRLALAQIAEVLGAAADVDRQELRVSAPTDGSAGDVRAILDAVDPHGDRVARFSAHSATLDDVFLTMTGASARAREADHA
jgi:ABC-2 type transport system ATP-binding protein